ncbi:MAG: hypothetical protein JWP97_6393 [Labilithrix sp.]|nr:hypothetical protein [Labilithrix sp.]
MTRLRLIALASVSLSIVAAGSLVACSDDTSIDPTDAGGLDTGTDSGKEDTGAIDGGADGADTGTDADAGVPITLANVADVVSEHMCNSFARCCFGTPTPPAGGLDGGGSFDRASCLSLYNTLGFENSSVGHDVYASGNVALDPAKAASCVAKIDTLKCTLSATDFQDIRSTCFSAVAGTVKVGDACAKSVECAAGLFCKPTAAGALAGTCAPLKAAAESCSDFAGQGDIYGAALLAEESCSYRGSGTPKLFCDTYADPSDPDAPPTDPTTWTCKAAGPVGDPCADSTWCASGICDPNGYQCVDPFVFFASDRCAKSIVH